MIKQGKGVFNSMILVVLLTAVLGQLGEYEMNTHFILNKIVIC